LPPEVVNVEADDRGIAYPPSSSGWFAPERVHYAFAISSYDLSALQRVTWKSYLDCLLLRRLRGLGYPTEAARELPAGFIDLMNRWEGSEDGHTKYRVIPSTDARIDTKRVLSSLLRMLGDKTELITNAQYELELQGDRTAVRINGELH